MMREMRSPFGKHDDEAPAGGRLFRGPPLDLPDARQTLFDALLAARRRRGGGVRILQDADAEPISYNDLVRSACALGAGIARITSPHEAVGLLLPTSAPAIIAFFALQARGRVPALLNFRAGASNLRAACELARVKRVITARRFVEAAGLRSVVSKLEPSISIIYLEDLRAAVTPLDKVVAVLRSLFPATAPRLARPEDAAVILFTSGTTGAAKGVALSHFNILANIAQCRTRIPFDLNWVFFNVLPIFHAFGLTGGTLLPLFGGMKTVLYPSPLDHNKIPKAIRAAGANVLIATDTFARLYARAADHDTLKGLLYVVLGGERVQDKTVRSFSQKSAAHILQGYGATECGPVIAVNQPQRDRPGTVGRLVPGMEARLEPVSGITSGARLFVRGPNVMIGYLDPDGRGVNVRPQDQWFDTGDLACIDDDGFITITGRIARFARVGAETVSLAAVEDHARAIWPEGDHAALSAALHGERESIILVTDQKDAQRAQFVEWARAHDIPQVEVPQRILQMRKLPHLPTGKPDYVKIARIIERRRAGGTQPAYPSKRASGAAGKEIST